MPLDTQLLAIVQRKLNDPSIIVDRSVFFDRNGTWAKEWAMVTSIYLQFSDNTDTNIDPDLFQALTRDQQNKIRYAPSSPLP